MISKEINKRWKDRTARQEIYSGSATRSPSLPYSTPRAPNSRVFFTMSTSSLWRRNLTHQFTHHNYVTTYSHLLHNYFTPIHYLITPLLHTYLLHTNFLHTYLLHTNLLHNYLPPNNLLHTTTYISILLLTTSTPRSI